MTMRDRMDDQCAERSVARAGASSDRGAARRPWNPAATLVGLGALALAGLGLSCAASDSGGMSGTGVSQGSISSFGSIFVNGVEWDVSHATIELDGVNSNETALRVGMVVRVDGNRSQSGLSGDAMRVTFDDSIEGPIESDPVETVAGIERTFAVLGTTVVMNIDQTSFDDGASFAGLVADDVVEVSGFVDSTGVVRATRIELKGAFPGVDDVELRGRVANLVNNGDGSGIFDLGTITIHYTSATDFKDTSRTSLAAGDLVEIEGTVRIGGDEIDATRIERETSGLGSGNSDDAKVEGIIATCVESPDYCVSGVPVDDSSATFDPPGFMPAVGDRVECEGRLESGVLIATRLKSRSSDSASRDVRIDASLTSIDAAARTLVILGVTIAADGDTRLEDKSDLDDENLSFSELQVGQFLEIEAISTGPSTARALSIERNDGEVGNDDVRLEGPVTALDPNAPSLSILGQSIPLDGGTVYRDVSGQTRSEEEFFRNPGDVMLGDVVRAEDRDAANLSILSESDEVEIETQN